MPFRRWLWHCSHAGYVTWVYCKSESSANLVTCRGGETSSLFRPGSGCAFMPDVQGRRFGFRRGLHVLDVEEDLLLPTTSTRVLARSHAFSPGSGIALLTDPQRRRRCKRMSLGPNS
jgi:hypothetical protein